MLLIAHVLVMLVSHLLYENEVLGEQMLLVLPTGPKPIAHEDKVAKCTGKRH